MTSAQATDAARAAWFGQFGYTGADDEVVTLRNGHGTAKAQDVWKVLQGLRALADEYGSHLLRAVDAAVNDRHPYDSAGILALDEFGPLTQYAAKGSGDWLPGHREIVLALLNWDEDAFRATFAESPLIPKETAKAA